MDPDALRHCLPGCQEFEQVAPQEWKVTMSVGISAIRGTYSGRVKISEPEPETRYRLAVEGSGAGNRIRGEGTITLADSAAGPDGAVGAAGAAGAAGETQITYEGDAHVQGPLAAVGQRLLPPAARLLADQFFKCMAEQVQD
jgi:carbon monoxide dehydrogenase subunit G